MSKYRQLNSKRKQKSRAKRQAREMCTVFNKSAGTISSGSSDLLGETWQTPEEFILSESKHGFIVPEETTIKRKRKHFVPKPLTAAA